MSSMSDHRCSPRRILVTGGAGFVGGHVAAALLSRGDDPVVLDDFSSGSAVNVPPGVAIVQADVADPAVVGRIAELRPDGVVHAAAQASVPRSLADPDRDRAVNLVGTAQVIAGTQAAGGCRLVFVSTGGGIYGETDSPATEEHLPRPKAYYSVHKYAAERYVELSGLPYAVARPANVYGPRQRSDLEGGVAAIFAERLLARQPIVINGSGEQRRDFVHVADVVSALLVMLDADRDGLWNVGTGRATTINGLLGAMQAVFGPAVEIQHLPARAGDVFNSCLAVDRLAADLGWRPTVTLEAGVRTLTPTATTR